MLLPAPAPFEGCRFTTIVPVKRNFNEKISCTKFAGMSKNLLNLANISCQTFLAQTTLANKTNSLQKFAKLPPHKITLTSATRCRVRGKSCVIEKRKNHKSSHDVIRCRYRCFVLAMNTIEVAEELKKHNFSPLLPGRRVWRQKEKRRTKAIS